MLRDLTDEKSTMVQVMAWCLMAPSHYLNHYWPDSMIASPGPIELSSACNDNAITCIVYDQMQLFRFYPKSVIHLCCSNSPDLAVVVHWQCTCSLVASSASQLDSCPEKQVGVERASFCGVLRRSPFITLSFSPKYSQSIFHTGLILG